MITNSKIGVLMGGLSSERDISLSTGRLVTASLIKNGAGNPPSVRYPVVVKPLREGSTIGISVVSEKKDLRPALDSAFQYGDSALIEEYIAGMEVTAGIIGDRPLSLIEIVPQGGV